MTGPHRQIARVLIFAGVALFGFAGTAAAAPARPADAFVESVGVNTHLSYGSTSIYRNYGQVEAKLSKLGVRYIRDGIHPGQAFHHQELRRLAGMGIKTNVIVGDPLQRWGTGSLATQLALVRTQLPGAVASLESANEYDNQGDTNWVTNLRDYQQELYTLAKADPILRSVPVVGPSFVRRESHALLGDISPWTDYGNIHPYPGGDSPDRDSHMGPETTAPRAAVGNAPLQATETGYHNALNVANNHKPADEQAAAIYFPRLYLDYFRRGIARSFAYELFDQRPDAGRIDNEANFGFVRNDFTEKPAFTALRRTIDLLEDPGAALSPSSLDYSIQGGRSTLRQMLLQKRDGSFYLVLWNAESVWNPTTRHAVASTASPVRVQLPGPARVDVYKPNQAGIPIASDLSTSSMAVEVSPSVTVVRIAPSGEPAPADPPADPDPEPSPASPTPGPVLGPPATRQPVVPPPKTPPPTSTPLPARPAPASPLRGDERKVTTRFLTLGRKARASRRERAEKRRLERWMQRRARTIRRQARAGGWAHQGRAARYRAIRAVLSSS